MKNRRHQRRKRLQKFFTEKRQRQELSSEYERGYRDGQHDIVMSLARVADKILDDDEERFADRRGERRP